jgi:hypothetical protein
LRWHPKSKSYPQKSKVGASRILRVPVIINSKNQSADPQRRFLHPFDWDKPASDAKHDNPGIDHMRLVSAQDSPVLSGRMGSNHALNKLFALRAKDMPKELLFASRRALIHSVQCLAHLLFDKPQVVIHRRVGKRQANRPGEQYHYRAQS